MTLVNLPWRDPHCLPPYTHRLKLLDLPTLEKRRSYLNLSFLSNLLNGSVDSISILFQLNFRINNFNVRNKDLLVIHRHSTNYGKFCPINSMCRLLNKHNLTIDNLNLKSKLFKDFFFNL